MTTRSRRSKPAPRIGLALAGGGPLGAIYEVGALCALEQSIEGLDFADCTSYIGVSAGGIIASCLANGLTPSQLCAGFIENSSAAPDHFDPKVLLHPNWEELSRRLHKLPSLAGEALWRVLVEKRSALGALELLGAALPTGWLNSDQLARQLRDMFQRPGRSDDFRDLKKRLLLVATDLDSGETVAFGRPGWDHVPISRAVQASAALPGLYPPVEIDGHFLVDGALKKTVHASLLLEEGLDLLFMVNPLVPYEVSGGDMHLRAKPRIPKLVDGGMPVVLSQMLRSLIHSRLELGMKAYTKSHPKTDIVFFEPDHRDAELFLANTFSYRHRRELAEHAYQATRADLLHRAPKLAPVLARHGLTLQVDRLMDPTQVLVRVWDTPSHTPTERALLQLDQVLNLLESRIEQSGSLNA
ncbi:patatin-like phospholipase family protein [Inhella gelatinilytica]|uniref:Patatin-like phospholipase family protein n=1 Tax=Inhella gelatinilytica TaxID=2795030 RepID=A0A931NCU4_9BURK|nr:patatin-like phospholipase family protein [Inhella gelatinilytica]MBH9552392.1 patatin-like phospholipase family protein [Inhella gelatinilytica]